MAYLLGCISLVEWSAVAMFYALCFHWSMLACKCQCQKMLKKCYIGDTYAEMQLPCLMKCICPFFWNAIDMFTQLYMPCLIKMQLPCFMQCASIGECWCGNDDIQLKMYCNCHVCCTAIAMYVVMHLPCVVYCICHVQRNIFAMFNELCLPCSNKMYFYFHDNIRVYKKKIARKFNRKHTKLADSRKK